MIGTSAARPIAQKPSEPPPTLYPVPDTGEGAFGAQRGLAVKVAFTGDGRRGDERVPCRSCRRQVRASNKTGLCRWCWVASGGPSRNARSRRGKGEARKREPREAIAAAVRMLESAARRAISEDPGEGLAALVAAEARIRQFTRQTGRDLVGQVGEVAVGEGLGWSKQRVYERWGGEAR